MRPLDAGKAAGDSRRTARRRNRIPFGATAVAVLAVAGASIASGVSGAAATSAAPRAAHHVTKRAASPTVQIRSVGNLGKILVTPKGFTLYRYLPDPANGTRSNCTTQGGCIQSWPALVLPKGHTKPVAPKGLTGLTAVKDSHGWQVRWNKHLLYTYTGDTKPGQANGEGLANIWYACIVSTHTCKAK
jgi:predicted lipoprotein with Yx(FWY)xxD motif